MGQYTSEVRKQKENKEQNSLELKIKDLNNEIESLKNKSLEINLDEIILVDNMRDIIDEEVDEIAESISEIGQLQPVLITLDNHLISGYNRYHGKKKLNHKTIAVFKYHKNYKDMSQLEFDKIQFAENEKRKSLDHIEISKLFNKYLNEGKSQADISKEFGKNKAYVSAVVSLIKLDDTIRQYFREFKVYAWSKKMFTMVNNSEDAVNNKFYVSNRGIVGWKALYEIAKHENLMEQKKAFIQKFKNRLSEEELKDDYFKDVIEEKKDKTPDEVTKTKIQSTIKSLETVSNDITGVFNDLNDNQKKNFTEAMELISKARLLFSSSL